MWTRPKSNTKGIEIKANNQDWYKFTDRQVNWTKYTFFFLGHDHGTQRNDQGKPNEIPSPIACCQGQQGLVQDEIELCKRMSPAKELGSLCRNIQFLIVCSEYVFVCTCRRPYRGSHASESLGTFSSTLLT